MSVRSLSWIHKLIEILSSPHLSYQLLSGYQAFSLLVERDALHLAGDIGIHSLSHTLELVNQRE